MNCPECGNSNAAGRTFCLSCGTSLTDPAEAPGAVVGVHDDVQAVELARIPSVLHAPTAWTIAKGVFLGLLLWSVFSAAVAFTFFAVALRDGGDGGEVLDVPAITEEPTIPAPTSTPCTCNE